MNPVHFRRVHEVFTSVRRLEPDRRKAALEELCQGDTELQRDVISLLDADLRPLPLDPEALAHPELLLAPGTELGPYSVQEHIGEGAFGDVYLARAHVGHAGPREIGCSEYFQGWLFDQEKNGGGTFIDEAMIHLLINQPDWGK